MEEVKQTTNFILKWALTVIILLSVIVLYFWDFRTALGIIVGGGVGVSNLYLLSFSLKKAIKFNPLPARAYMVVQYLLKYGFWFFVLFALLKNNQINLVSTIIGMLIVKAVIFVVNIFDMWPQQQNECKGIRKEVKE